MFVLFLCACQSSILTQAITATPTESSVVTQTSEPTKTPEPSSTPDLRFTELLPETLEDCKQNNVIRLGHFDEDFANLREKEKETVANIDLSNVKWGYRINDFNIIDPLKDKLPGAIGLGDGFTRGVDPNPVISCSYMETGSEKGIYILGIMMRHGQIKGSKEVTGIVHFAVDPEATKALGQHVPGPDIFLSETDLEANYPKIVTGQYDYYTVYLVIEKLGASDNETYKQLLSLYASQFYDGNASIIGDLINNRYYNDLEAKQLFNECEGIIFPTVGFGVTTFKSTAKG